MTMDGFLGEPVLETIRKHYDQVFLAERKVADFILNNPEKAVTLVVSELANYSGVSDATVIRLCKHIGFQGYQQLKIYLSRDIGRKQVGGEYLADTTPSDTVEGVFHNIASDIIAICKGIRQEEMMACVQLIQSCGYVHLAAVGNSTTLANYMGFRLGRLGARCTYNMLPEQFLNHINLAQPEDIVLAISQSGSSIQVVHAAKLAKEKNLKIIVIAAHEFSPLSKLADHLLLSGIDERPLDINSKYSLLREQVVIDALLQFIGAVGSEDSAAQELALSETKL